MAALYFLVRLALTLLHALVRWRAGRLERRFERASLAAQETQKIPSTAGDEMASVLRLQALLEAACACSRAEALYLRWQRAGDRLGALRGRLAGYRGRYVPYALAIKDTLACVAVMEFFGLSLTGLAEQGWGLAYGTLERWL